MRMPSNLRGYRLDRPLGKGGMGSVYLAEKLSTHQRFAIKFLKEEYLEDESSLARFEREVEALRAIRHPNVVNVFEWSVPRDDPDAKPFVIMEFLQGEGLDAMLRRRRVLAPQVAVSILLQVLEGLASAHAIGVVHRDLGPSNIFLTPQTNGAYLVRILDFGLARPFGHGRRDPRITQVGAVMGKPGYIAPEAFRHEPVDVRSDVFACGMLLYRMLAGRLPYQESEAELLWAERYAERNHDREYPGVREHAYWVPEALSLVVAKAIRRKPDERYQMAEDMQVDLLGVEDSVLARASASVPDHLQVEQSETAGGVSQLESQFESFERRTSRGKVIGVVAGSAVAAAVLAAFLILGPLGGSPQADGGGGVDGANVAVADPGAVRAPPADASASPPVKIDDAAAAESAGSPPGAEASAAVGADEGAAVVAPRDVASLSSSVLIVVVGVPARAKVTVGNIEATGDPPQVRVPRSDADLRLVVEARGYQKHVQAVVPSEDRVITVRMRRLPSVPPVSRPDAGRETGGTAFPDFPEDS